MVLALLLVQALAAVGSVVAGLIQRAVRRPPAAAVLLASGLAATVAHATEARRPVVLTLVNASDTAIEEAYVGRTGTAALGADVLGLRIVRPHRQIAVAAPAMPGCAGRVLVIFADGRYEQHVATDVCHGTRVTFRGPGEVLSSDEILTWLRASPGLAPGTRGPTPAARPLPALHPVRVFMTTAAIPPEGAAAYGVMALRATPTPASSARLTMACMAFLAHLPAQSDLPASVPLSAQMLTVWPLKPAARAQAEQGSCPAMLQGYDLPGGLDAIRDAESQTQELTGRGPFLIGWSPSRMRGVRDAVVLVLDMSDFDSQDSFDDAFVFWQRKVVGDPKLWRHGFSLERLRLAVRDFVDHYGTSIQAAIRMWGGHG